MSSSTMYPVKSGTSSGEDSELGREVKVADGSNVTAIAPIDTSARAAGWHANASVVVGVRGRW